MTAFCGTAEGIRTPDLLVRSKHRSFCQFLYDFFLRHIVIKSSHILRLLEQKDRVSFYAILCFFIDFELIVPLKSRSGHAAK